MKSLCAIAFFLPILIGIASCSKEARTYTPLKNGCDSVLFSYQYDIKPIIQTNCSGPTCHIAGTGNYDFSTYEVMANNIRGGKFEYRLLLPASDPQHMPQTAPPDPAGYEFRNPCDLYKIITWIRQGYPNN